MFQRQPTPIGRRFFIPFLFIATTAHAYSDRPPTRKAGQPPGGADNTCLDCHDSFGLNEGDVLLDLKVSTTGTRFSTYEPGIGYDLLVEISSPMADRLVWGFELVPMVGSEMAGELSAGPSSSITPDGGADYLTHSPALYQDGGATWDFAWTAPATDQGDVSFYVCGNAGSDSRGSREDYIECQAFVVSPDGGGGGGSLLRIARLDSIAPAFNVFDVAPCTTAGADMRICDEGLAVVEEVLDPLPQTIPGGGRLVFLEFDSDMSTPGGADTIAVSKDPAVAGGLLVTLR